MTRFVKASRSVGPRPASVGRGRLFSLTIVLTAGLAPACVAPRLPKPHPPSVYRRVSQGEAFFAHGSPLADSTRLEDSAAVTTFQGRAPMPPHWTPAFRAQARAHADERYVHALTARANGRNNISVAPAEALEPVTPDVSPAVTETGLAAGPAAPLPGTSWSSGAVAGGAVLPASVSRPVYVPPAAPTYTPPTSTTPTDAPPAHVPPTVPPTVTPTAAAPGGGVAPFSLASVPANLRDVAALSAREEALADQSIQLGLERRAVLRVARAMSQHQSANTETTRAALDDAFAEYQSSAVSTRGLSLRSGAQAFAAAEPTVSSHLSRVTEDRKAVTRLIVALRQYEATPTAANGVAVSQAVAKYGSNQNYSAR